VQGPTGASGPQGPSGPGGPAISGAAFAVFFSGGNIGASGNCIANMGLVPAGNDAVCPVAVATDTYSAEVIYLLGPMAASGASVSNLEATVSVAPGAGKSYTEAIVDNTTGSTVLSCSIADTATFCTNTGTATVTAGHFLEVKVTEVGGAAHKSHRVSFRF
jgi:hypothetical protein